MITTTTNTHCVCKLTPMEGTTLDAAMIEAVARAKHIAMLTGAGVSAESGIPTFRDALEGHWAKFDPTALASPEAFLRQPDVVTRWYDERRCAVLECEPNHGHFAITTLTQIKQRHGERLTLITQNVDQLHQRSGSCDVIELHGSLIKWRCSRCDSSAIEQGGPFASFPPLCNDCGGYRRPDVVWFGEILPPDALGLAREAAESCDLFFSIGTSGLVEPAASIALVAKQLGALIVEINPQATPLTPHADWYLPGRSGEVLPKLVEAVEPFWS